MDEIKTLQSRGYTVGFLDGNAGPEAQNYDVSASAGDWRYAGLVRQIKGGRVVMEVKHKIVRGMALEFLSPAQWQPIRVRVADFYDARSGKPIGEMSAGNLGQSIEIPLPRRQIQKLCPLCVARTKIN